MGLMKLQYLSNEMVESLHSDFVFFKDHYMDEDNKWFNEYFVSKNALLDSSLEFVDFKDELNYNSDDPKQNYDNIKLIYESLKLTPSRASQERIWACLTHGYLFDFVKTIRIDAIKSGEEQKIKNVFLLTNGKRRGLFINSLAKLWWTGYLTYDEENKEDPYQLTRMFSMDGGYISLIMLISSYNFISNKKIFLGVLDAINKLKNRGITIKREVYIYALRYLNGISGVLLLDVIDREEIAKKVYDSLIGIYPV